MFINRLTFIWKNCYLYIDFIINFRGTRLSFDFNGVRLSFNEYDLTNYFIPVIYYFYHPTFITSGDKLSLIFENNKIQGIFNHTDGSSYLITHCVWISKKSKNFITLLVFLYHLCTNCIYIMSIITISTTWFNNECFFMDITVCTDYSITLSTILHAIFIS